LTETVNIFLSHDVDWPLHGPGTEHILKRKERFPPEVIEKVLKEGYNPYFGIFTIAEIEENYGVRSTFFFRPRYDDGSGVSDYADTIRELSRGGWEIGVHLNNVTSVESIKEQLKAVQDVAPHRIAGSRVHYLRISIDDYYKIKSAGLLYDSSLKTHKDRISPEDMGYQEVSGVIVFPITIMDAYLFTHMHVREPGVIDAVKSALNVAENHGKDLITLLWHDSSINMIGGRMYGKILEYLSARDNVRILKGIEAYEYALRKARSAE